MVFPLDGILTILDHRCQERFSISLRLHFPDPFLTTKRLADLPSGQGIEGLTFYKNPFSIAEIQLSS